MLVLFDMYYNFRILILERNVSIKIYDFKNENMTIPTLPSWS